MIFIKKKYINESNTNADSAAKNFPRRDILLVVKKKHMLESNTHVGNAAKNFQQRVILHFKKGLYIKE